jgi:hypothetical protein
MSDMQKTTRMLGQARFTQSGLQTVTQTPFPSVTFLALLTLRTSLYPKQEWRYSEKLICLSQRTCCYATATFYISQIMQRSHRLDNRWCFQVYLKYLCYCEIQLGPVLVKYIHSVVCHTTGS